MLTGRGKSPEVAASWPKAESLIAKIAIVVVIRRGGLAMPGDVGKASPIAGDAYGRWLTVKLALSAPRCRGPALAL